ncbi:hypothetical protein [Tsukamurella soli]|uniref:hypothetical protein n=1 Tax=Tsukamurella soli TaxID=644556 RepID=UPI00361097FB
MLHGTGDRLGRSVAGRGEGGRYRRDHRGVPLLGERPGPLDGGRRERGFVRVVARGDNHRVIGVQATGAHVSEMSGEFVHAIEMGAVLEDIAGTVHVHPTLTEGFHESALKALGHAIHI